MKCKVLSCEAQQSLGERTGTWMCKTGCQEVSWRFSSLIISPSPSQGIFTGVPLKRGRTTQLTQNSQGKLTLGLFYVPEGQNPHSAPWSRREDFTSFPPVCLQNNQLLTLLPQKPTQLPHWHCPLGRARGSPNTGYGEKS